MARARKHKNAAAPGRAERPRARTWWAPALILAAGLFTYSNIYSNPFIVDDTSSVVQNLSIRDLTSGAVFRPPTDHPMSGRPLVNLSFAMNYAIGGAREWGYHAVSVGLHVLCGLLVFGLVGRQLSTPLACAVALLWTVHPLNSEVVNYITQRTESMMAACFLLTMYAASARGASQGRWQVVAVVACAAGMACKETMAVAPLAVWLYDSAYEYGSAMAALRARWRFYAALASTWLVVGVLTATSGQSLDAGFTFAKLDPWVYLLNQGEMIVRYLRLAVWPDSLVLYYGWPRTIGLAEAWPYVAFVATLFLVTVVTLVRRPRIGALGAWVFLTLGPTSSLIPILSEVGAERRMYLPMVGLVTLAVVAGGWLWRRATAGRTTSAWVPAALVAIIAVAYVASTRTRNREYASSLRIAETVRERWPSPQASLLLGAAFIEAGRPADALPHLRESAERYPMAYHSLSDALLKAGQPKEAIVAAETFLRTAPPAATRMSHMVLAQAYLSTGEPTRAIDELRIVLKMSPTFVTAHALLADVLALEQRLAEAIPHYQAFLASSPQSARAATGLGVALVAAGRGAESVAAFRTAADAEPGNARFRQNLARALGDHGDANEALKYAQEAVSLDANDPASFEVLGRALLRLGRTADARTSFMRALQIDPTYAPAMDGLRAVAK